MTTRIDLGVMLILIIIVLVAVGGICTETQQVNHNFKTGDTLCTRTGSEVVVSEASPQPWQHNIFVIMDINGQNEKLLMNVDDLHFCGESK